MIIRVTYAKEFDSDKIYDKDYIPTVDEFENLICEKIYDDIDLSDEVWEFELIKK